MSKHDPHALEHWNAIIARWQKSGLGVVAFCRTHGIHKSSLHYWRNVITQLEHTNHTGTTKNTSATKPKPTRTDPRTAPSFVPLRVVSDSIVEIGLPSGLQLRVPLSADAHQLARLVLALGAAPC